MLMSKKGAFLIRRYLSRVSLLVTATLLLTSPLAVHAELDFSKNQERAKSRLESIKKQSQQRVESLKGGVEKRTKEIRSKACEARKNNIEKRLESRINLVKQYKIRFDSVYNKNKDFSAMSAANEAKQRVEIANSNLSTEIEALESLNTELDCSNPDAVAVAIDIYKNQLDSVKNLLKEYRESIKMLIRENSNENI